MIGLERDQRKYEGFRTSVVYLLLEPNYLSSNYNMRLALKRECTFTVMESRCLVQNTNIGFRGNGLRLYFRNKPYM